MDEFAWLIGWAVIIAAGAYAVVWIVGTIEEFLHPERYRKDR